MLGWLSYLLPKLGIKSSNEMVGGLLAFPKTYHVLFIIFPFDSSNGRNFNLIKGAKAWAT